MTIYRLVIVVVVVSTKNSDESVVVLSLVSLFNKFMSSNDFLYAHYDTESFELLEIENER